MKGNIIKFVQAHHWIYFCYYWVMTCLVNLIKLFVRPDDKLILFVVYGGKIFSDSPKCMYEAMSSDERFKDYRMVWAFRAPNLFPEVPNRIRIDTLRYYITALKARCWITNESVTRALKFKGKHVFYFSTTHTALPKYGGVDVKSESTFTSIGGTKYDCTCAQSEAEKVIQLRKYGLKASQVKVCGYPKNDRIANHTDEEVEAIRRKLNINDGKKVLLYAPTFREGVQKMTVDLAKWVEMLGDDYWILFRAHHSMTNSIQLKDYSNCVIDVSSYPDNTDLLIASDVLISDYSGIFFEFGVQEKPMFCYAYDKEEYTKNRGLYVNLWDVLPGGHLNELQLLDYIKNGDDFEKINAVNAFRKQYITAYGNATQQCVNIIYDNLKKG